MMVASVVKNLPSTIVTLFCGRVLSERALWPPLRYDMTLFWQEKNQ